MSFGNRVSFGDLARYSAQTTLKNIAGNCSWNVVNFVINANGLWAVLDE